MIASIFILIFSLISLLISSGLDSPIWPQPTIISLESNKLTLDKSFYFDISSSNQSDIINKAINRYLKLINVPNNISGNIFVCTIKVVESTKTAKNKFSAKTAEATRDESYELTVTATGDCLLTSQSEWGTLRGLETFTQLLTREEDGLLLLLLLLLLYFLLSVVIIITFTLTTIAIIIIIIIIKNLNNIIIIITILKQQQQQQQQQQQ